MLFVLLSSRGRNEVACHTRRSGDQVPVRQAGSAACGAAMVLHAAGLLPLAPFLLIGSSSCICADGCRDWQSREISSVAHLHVPSVL